MDIDIYSPLYIKHISKFSILSFQITKICVYILKGVITIEQSLILIKPDALKRNLVGNILKTYEENNSSIKNIKFIEATKEQAINHYLEHKNKSFFNELIEYITSGPLVAAIIEGDNAIKKVRSINNDIRECYALDITQNSVHGSDSIKSANREIDIWFKK